MKFSYSYFIDLQLANVYDNWQETSTAQLSGHPESDEHEPPLDNNITLKENLPESAKSSEQNSIGSMMPKTQQVWVISTLLGMTFFKSCM